MVLGKCNIINTESNNHSVGIDLKLQQGKGVMSRYVVLPMASLGDLDHIGHTDHYNPDHTNQNFGGLRNCHHTFKNLWLQWSPRKKPQVETFGANLGQYALLQSWAGNWWTHPRDQVIGVHPIRSFKKNKHQLECCKKSSIIVILQGGQVQHSK